MVRKGKAEVPHHAMKAYRRRSIALLILDISII